MSKNKETVEEFMAAFNALDHERILACLTDDVEWVIPGLSVHKGKKAFDKEIEHPDFTGKPVIKVSRMVEENDVVLAEGSVIVRKATGETYPVAFCDVFEMRAGKVKKLISYLVPLSQNQ